MNILNIVALEDVSLDLKIAEEFYENQNKGLGKYFKDSILSDIESLWLYGGIQNQVLGLYRLLSKRFPYGIYYDIDNNIVRIIAVLDLRQNPSNISLFISGRRNENLVNTESIIDEGLNSGISSKSHDEIISDIKNKFNKENK